MTGPAEQLPWYEVDDVADIDSPALLVYPERVGENVRRMLAIAEGPQQLRPHIKTHKMPALVKLQLALGISKFKCATIAEAEMAAAAGAGDLLLAYQPVGPAVARFVELIRRFPKVRFSVIVDKAEVAQALSAALCHRNGQIEGTGANQILEMLIDIDIGQHRTGIAPGPEVLGLYRFIANCPGLKPAGLHAYDGHITESDPARRATACEQAFAPVARLREEIRTSGFEPPRIVTSGTPTFPFHAKRGGVECSPGTCVFWDAGYAARFPDLGFIPAAVVLTRVISKPAQGRLCLDLGHKALASEMPHPRAVFLNLEGAKAVSHSEEHLVIETGRSSSFSLGDCLYALPWHICPTVALHSQAQVIENRHVAGSWRVTARERRLTI
jgi:D-threonine aldolase